MPRTMGSHFGAWLKARRETAGLSIRGLAEVANVSHSHIHWLEIGKREPTSDVAEHLAAALGVPVSDVLIASFPDRFTPFERECLRRWVSEDGRPC